MSMAGEIVRHTGRDPVALGQVLAQSGYFSDAKQAAQAAVKVMAGEELGLGPVASMTGIHMVQGKVTVGANAQAALLRRHPDYDYAVREHTDQVCVIEFIYKGKPAGTSSFSLDDAAKAGLMSNPTWKKFPRNMLFARAMSNGIKWYAPDVSAGAPLYTPDELGAEVIYDDGGDVVSVVTDTPALPPPPAPVAALQEPAPDAPPVGDDAEPFDPQAVLAMLKDEFGAEVVREVFTQREIKTFGELTPEKAHDIREQLRMDTTEAAA
jgi:hypothetical protein